MFSSSSPASSPLGNRGLNTSQEWRLHRPRWSSPLSPTSGSSMQNSQLRRKCQYKSQSHKPIHPTLHSSEDSPQRKWLRDRFKEQCLDAKERRAKAVSHSRQPEDNGNDGADSDDAMDGDVLMGVENEIYRRVIQSEKRREQHAMRVSFEREHGSSIDPSMYDDMDTLEMELTGTISKYRSPTPPSDVDIDDSDIQDYLTKVKESEWQGTSGQAVIGLVDLDREDPGELEREFITGAQCEQPSPSKSLFSDSIMSSPPSSPSVKLGSLDTSSTCPFCSLYRDSAAIACPSCLSEHSLEDAQRFWLDSKMHPGLHDNRFHKPLASKMPSGSGMGVVVLCSASNCDWCFAL